MRFYDQEKYKYQPPEFDEEKNITIFGRGNKHNKLSYCATCKILRPPRSFHCGTCGVCVEAHDHHCPWVGTCVGHRNARYFVGFLLFTATHALCTFAIAITAFLYAMNDGRAAMEQLFSQCIALYTGIIALSLYGFFLYQFCYLVRNNIASNEEIRGRWNGHPKNEAEARIYKDDAGCWDKFNHFVYGPLPESKLHKFATLVEISDRLKHTAGSEPSSA